MIHIQDFHPQFSVALPGTYSLLASANLVIHPSVSRILLHGSRGLAGGHRPDSDIDLSLIVDLPPEGNIESKLNEVTKTSLDHWQSPTEIDLAVIFDLKKCDLKCFDPSNWDPHLCLLGGLDCFGLYKIQKGFSGLLTNAGIRVELMYPCLKIWQKS
jgi:hypothetical protein